MSRHHPRQLPIYQLQGPDDHNQRGHGYHHQQNDTHHLGQYQEPRDYDAYEYQSHFQYNADSPYPKFVNRLGSAPRRVSSHRDGDTGSNGYGQVRSDHYSQTRYYDQHRHKHSRSRGDTLPQRIRERDQETRNSDGRNRRKTQHHNRRSTTPNNQGRYFGGASSSIYAGEPPRATTPTPQEKQDAFQAQARREHKARRPKTPESTTRVDDWRKAIKFRRP